MILIIKYDIERIIIIKKLIKRVIRELCRRRRPLLRELTLMSVVIIILKSSLNAVIFFLTRCRVRELFKQIGVFHLWGYAPMPHNSPITTSPKRFKQIFFIIYF